MTIADDRPKLTFFARNFGIYEQPGDFFGAIAQLHRIAWLDGSNRQREILHTHRDAFPILTTCLKAEIRRLEFLRGIEGGALLPGFGAGEE